MGDLLTIISRKQTDLAFKIADKLFKKKFNKKTIDFKKNAMYFSGSIENFGQNVDPEAFDAFFKSELKSCVVNAVRAYTDWTATKIVRSKRYTPRQYPMPNKCELSLIAIKYNVTTTLLLFVIQSMISTKNLPLLGTNNNGLLVPNKVELLAWKKYFDWSKK